MRRLAIAGASIGALLSLGMLSSPGAVVQTGPELKNATGASAQEGKAKPSKSARAHEAIVRRRALGGMASVYGIHPGRKNTHVKPHDPRANRRKAKAKAKQRKRRA